MVVVVDHRRSGWELGGGGGGRELWRGRGGENFLCPWRPRMNYWSEEERERERVWASSSFFEG